MTTRLQLRACLGIGHRDSRPGRALPLQRNTHRLRRHHPVYTDVTHPQPSERLRYADEAARKPTNGRPTSVGYSEIVPDSTRALSFGAVATAYHRYRPRTPAALLDWLLPPTAKDAVDLAAGTGALTELLVARVPAVTAVEPDPGMRDVLQSAAPAARILAGTAEDIPLPDASADVLCVSSAWHWFDHERAVPEIARVLRDGGRLAVLGNGVTRELGWMTALREQRFTGSDEQRRRHREVVLPEGSPFGPGERHEVRWQQQMSVDDLLNLLETFSRVITATPQERQELRERARTILQTHPDTSGREQLDVPMRSWGWRADRLPRDR